MKDFIVPAIGRKLYFIISKTASDLCPAQSFPYLRLCLCLIQFASHRQHGKTACDHFTLDDHILRDLQRDIGKVPYIFDPQRDHFVCNILCGAVGYADHGDLRGILCKTNGHICDITHHTPVDFLTDLFRRGIKDFADMETVMAEIIISQKRCSQGTCADQDSRNRLFPSQILFDLADQFIDIITDAALAGYAGKGNIFADNDQFDLHVFGQLRRGDVALAFCLHFEQFVQIGRHPPDGRYIQ